MYVEEMMALVRLSENGDALVADLAKAVITLVEQLRDASLRADFAEASLELERKMRADTASRLARADGHVTPRLPRATFEFGGRR